METGPWLKVSSDRLVKPGIEPGTPGLQGKLFIHYTTAAPNVYLYMYVIVLCVRLIIYIVTLFNCYVICKETY